MCIRDSFKTLKEKLGKKEVIAEDLGYLTPAVLKMVKKTGYPGMKVLQFAFDPREESDYLPHNYTRNSVVYTGTHDNQTTTAWVEEIGRADRAFAKQYLHVKRSKDVPEAMVRAALSSVSDTAVIPVQDWLGPVSYTHLDVYKRQLLNHFLTYCAVNAQY